MENGSVQSLDRAFMLLELLCQSPKGLAIHELTQQTGLNKSTVHRLLATMLRWGYVQRSENAVYRAGMRICELGDYIQQNLDIIDLARAPMEKLSRDTGETVHLVEWDGDEIVYIYKVESIHGAIRMVSRIGMRRPLYCTGVGKAMLACREDEEILTYWNRVEHTAFTSQTIVQQDVFMREIRAIRARGFAEDNEENELGVRCAAAPIRDRHGEARYAVSVSAPLSRMPDERIAELTPMLLKTVGEISDFLGYHQQPDAQ